MTKSWQTSTFSKDYSPLFYTDTAQFMSTSMYNKNNINRGGGWPVLLQFNKFQLKSTPLERNWILYDCANSAYAMAIATALFPIYFNLFNGNSMMLGYFNAIASLLIACISPILGAIADYQDYKKRFFVFFFTLGVAGTFFLAFVPFGHWENLVFLYIISSIGFAGTNIFYDAFLVDVTTPNRFDLVSSRGFAYGYITSVIPFFICLLVILGFSVEALNGYRLSFIITACWWGLLSVPLIQTVKQQHFIPKEAKPIRNSFKRLADTFRKIRHHRSAFLFLLAYFFYIDGIDTIIRMVVPYAETVLGPEAMNTVILLSILLVIQVLAFPFSLLFGRLAGHIGTLAMIRVGIVIYIVVVLMAFRMTSLWHVFMLGIVVASAQGGTQALSRSYFALLIPPEQSNEFFGFYNIFGKFASIMGPAIMSFITDLTDNARLSIFGILPLFIIGFALTFLQKPVKNT